MAQSRAELGDSHNFGRRVSVRGRRIAKPRALLWEWLVLGADSPLRRLLDEAAIASGLGQDAFAFVPKLRFFPAKSGIGGEVERVTLRPLRGSSAALRDALATIVGRSLALWSWLGLSDLHWENLVLGLDGGERIVFGPLDVEMILGDFASPTETKLLPDADPEYAALCRHAAGVRRVLPYLGKPLGGEHLIAMAGAYRSTLELLDRSAAGIAAVFADLPELRDTPIRICLRSTGEYVRAHVEPPWPPLLDAEIEQLSREDIPYFFRLYGRPGIHYYGDATLEERRRLPLQGDVPQLDPILQVSRGLRSPSRRKLREEGLFALLGAFDHEALRGRYERGGFAVTFGARRIALTLPNGDELESKRNMSAFVGSAYLPCRCGEVRSVFVPKVTRCKGP